MATRPPGIVLLAVALLVTGLAGVAAFWAVFPRTANTSPLAALFAVVWSGAYIVTAILTWGRSRLAPVSFLVAIGLLLFPASFIHPGGPPVFPAVVVLGLVGFLGYRYLRAPTPPK
jgi:hypothetical protein